MRQGSIASSMAKHTGSQRARSARTGSLAGALGLAVACLFATAPADAKPEYPGKLVDAGATCVVTCLTCHTDPAGGADKLRTANGMPFGLLFGVAVSTWTPTNTAALDAFAAATSDADKDMMSDLDEVKAGRDPLVPGAASICTPTYGCGARVAPAPPRSELATAAALLMAAALAFAGRWRAKRPSA